MPPYRGAPEGLRGLAIEVVVVGAGLSGLAAAADLVSAGHQIRVVEARNRVGGRVMTLEPEEGGRFDLGATWIWDDQPHVRALAVQLGIEVFGQPADGVALQEQIGSGPVAAKLCVPPAWRFSGGTQQLCGRLADRLPPGSVSLGQRVTAVSADAERVEVSATGPDGTPWSMAADIVVIALPPRLALQEVSFTPQLPSDLLEVMEATPTWMGEALKCVVVYDSPFWRETGLSGTAFSEVGPLSEVHDASEPGGPAALWGFVAFDADWRGMDPHERVPAVLQQLGRLFGPRAADPAQYYERDWSADPNTCEDEHRHGPVVDYGHPWFARPLWRGRLLWAGTETAEHGGGHLEGAIVAGRRAARLVSAGT